MSAETRKSLLQGETKILGIFEITKPKREPDVLKNELN